MPGVPPRPNVLGDGRRTLILRVVGYGELRDLGPYFGPRPPFLVSPNLRPAEAGADR